MPLFSFTTPFDQVVERATSEMNTSEDWGLIMDICDMVTRTPDGPRDCLKAIVKRMNHKIPHVAMQSLTLLDACINNCGHKFHLEVASRDFVSECRTLINGKVGAHAKVAQTLKQYIKKWSENEFKTDPALNLIPTLYNSLKTEGHDFTDPDVTPKKTPALSSDPNVVQSQQEEEDIAKAIALSLQEDKKSAGTKASSLSSLYPTFNSAPVSSNKPRELRMVRALYDFEAAEDNELTFKAGEIISILDDSDANWWKGTSSRGEGLFPANFVTADLSVEPETKPKSVKFNEEVEVKTVEPIPDVLEIDEEKIDTVLAMLQNADPTGETNPDPPDMVSLEEQAKAMGPLIDQELEKVDRKHASLMELNAKVMDALQMYHNLMKEQPAYNYSTLPKPGHYTMPPGSMMYNGQMMPPPPYMPPGQMVPPQQIVGMAQAPQGQMAGMAQGQVPPVMGQMPPVQQGQPQMAPPPQSFSPPPTSEYNMNDGAMAQPPHGYVPASTYQSLPLQQQPPQDAQPQSMQQNSFHPNNSQPPMYAQMPPSSAPGPPSFQQQPMPQQQPLL